MTILSNIITSSSIVTNSNTASLTNKTLINPIINLGGTEGTASQVLVSQGAGVAPTWSTPETGINTGKAIAMAIVFG